MKLWAVFVKQSCLECCTVSVTGKGITQYRSDRKRNVDFFDAGGSLLHDQINNNNNNNSFYLRAPFKAPKVTLQGSLKTENIINNHKKHKNKIH